MFSNEKPRTSNFRNAYAQHSDFCAVFEKGIKPLYLLAFLLTANHKDAEQCFVSTVEERVSCIGTERQAGLMGSPPAGSTWIRRD